MANLIPRVLARAAGRLVARQQRQVRAQYFRDSPYLFNWRPALRDARDDVGAALHLAAARAVDAIQNSGWISGIIDAALSSMIGNGLRLNARPDPAVFGGDQQAASAWARDVERRFEIWARSPQECDAAAQMTFAQQQACAVRAWFGFGEIVAILPLIRRQGVTSLTKAQLISPHRLKNQSMPPDLVQGVRLDGNGAPTGYVFRRRLESGAEQDVEIRARDREGRPQVVHVFDGWAGQVRGITPLAPVLKVVKQYDQLADATLTTTLLQTIFAATVTTDKVGENWFEGLTTDDEGPLAQYLGAKGDWYENAKIDLGGHGRIAHMLPGEDLKFHGAEHPNENYESFGKGLLREICRCAGVLYEAGTGDFAGATYSSVRMGVSTIWPTALYRREHIAGRFAQAVYEAWLEEEIATGRITLPGGLDAFLAQRSAVARSDWRGPARPTADDLKTARAQSIRLANGTRTLEAEAAEDGQDWEDNAEQLKREIDRYEELGLTHPYVAATQPEHVEPSLLDASAGGEA